MPTDLREACLAQLKQRVIAYGGFATVDRNPDWVQVKPTVPACAIYDGAETVEDLEVGTVLISTAAAITVHTLAATVPAAITELNRLRGLVRAAIGADPTLASQVLHTRYAGCAEPEMTQLEGSDCEASLELAFMIERREAELDPYRTV